MNRPFLFSKARALSLVATAAALLLAGCNRKPAGMPGMGMPMGPMEVGVLTISPQPVTLTQDLPGRTSSYRIAEVRARVNGIVQKRLFKEGSDVKEGQVLYEIDPAPYEAELENAKGALARSEANVETSQIKEKRYRELAKTKVVSPQDYDDIIGPLHANQAEVLSARAAVKIAQINLDYTRVTSPVSGRVGVSQVTEGAYVQAANATLLATVQQLDPMYVDVPQSTNELLRLKRAVTNGELAMDKEGHARVKLILDDGSEYAHEGTLQFSDVTVSPTTSSVTLRAIFPNPDSVLLPGMFVRARLQQGQKNDAILVPQPAVARNSKGEPTVMIVGAEDKAEIRVLETSRTVGSSWLVTSGLKPGDRVIMNNLQKLRPGAPVKPVPFAPEGGPAASTAAR